MWKCLDIVNVGGAAGWTTAGWAVKSGIPATGDASGTL